MIFTTSFLSPFLFTFLAPFLAQMLANIKSVERRLLWTHERQMPLAILSVSVSHHQLLQTSRRKFSGWDCGLYGELRQSELTVVFCNCRFLMSILSSSCDLFYGAVYKCTFKTIQCISCAETTATAIMMLN